MRWLVVSPYLPHPAIGHGGGTAVLQLCRALAQQHETVLLCYQREAEGGLQAHLEQRGVRVHTVPLRSEQARGLRRLPLLVDRLACALRSQWRQRPLMAEKYDRAAMHLRLQELVREFRPHVIQVEYSFMASMARSARIHVDESSALWHNDADPAEGVRPHVLLNTHEIGTLPRLRNLARAHTPWARLRRGRELAMWAAHDLRLVDAADTVLCVTEQDRLLLRSLGGSGAPKTVALGTDVDQVPTRRAETSVPTLLFVGSFAHPPNLEGVLWLCDEVLPRVWERRPDVQVEIVGRDAPEAVKRRAATSRDRVRVHGFVEDLDEFYARSTLFVAPLQSGGGIKIKVLEAMGHGAAVVTTPIGAEGIDDGAEACAIAATAADFADAIVRLVEDPAQQQALATRARRRIEDHFSWASIVRQLTQIVEESPRN